MTIKYNLNTPKADLAAIILYNSETYLLTLSDKYERFKASQSGVPIFSRTFEDEYKINNTINNDFMGDIVDSKLGYMLSIPITYNYDHITGNPPPPMPDDIRDFSKNNINIDSPEQELVDEIVIRCNLDDLNLETMKYADVCGTAARLSFINEDGEPDMINLPPWEVVYVYNNSETKLLAAVRYYTEIVVDQNNSSKTVLKAEYYDERYVYYFIEDDTDIVAFPPLNTTASQIVKMLKFIPDMSIKNGPVQLHGFNSVPIREYVNNTERLGSCDKIIELLDVYDRCLSDQTSEIEQFRLAYLALYGLKADEQTLQRIKQTGAFEMSIDGKVEFVTKELNATALENLLKKLEDNILRFAKAVNFTDDKFGGNLSGVAIKYKLLTLEHKCSISELKFKKADREVWELIADVYARKRKNFDPKKIKRIFTRNIPVNLLEEARIQRELKGLVSNETRLSLASFIENPKLEMKKIEHEMKTGVLAMMDNFYETLEEANSDEGTMAENDQYNEWRLDHRQSGKAPEAVNDDNKQ